MTTLDLTITDWLRIIRAEFNEMPGLRLTASQMQRLWGLDEMMCGALVQALVAAGYLRRTSNGAYARA